jgi:hypothetical protein
VALKSLGTVEMEAGNLERAAQVPQEALARDQQEGDLRGVANAQQVLAWVSLRAGRAREARGLQSGMVDYVVSCGDTEFLATTLETSACIAAELGEGPRAARLLGAVEALRQEAGIPVPQPDAALFERFLAPARAAIARRVWDAELAAGRALTQQQAATLLISPMPGT